MRCHHCDNGFECCHETSVRHADGTTECLGAQPCGLAHDLHVWAVDCEVTGCSCALVDLEVEADALLLAA